MPTVAETIPGVPPFESPLFGRWLDETKLDEQTREAAQQLATRGFAVIDFPDPEIDDRIDRIKADLAPCFGDVDLADPNAVKTGHNLRVQDAWTHNEDVRAIASNPQLLELLSSIYGRRAFPFQTLNFPIGTQQQLHSDSIHFSSLPERFMCGVWLAMEDIDPSAGPLQYVPGSHSWPIVSNAAIGRNGHMADRNLAQEPFEQYWQAMVDAAGSRPEPFLARKGQALIWAANLLHGGAPQEDSKRTRWSQVTHYFFEDCIYYTPTFSDENIGRFETRQIIDVSSGAPVENRFLGRAVTAAPAAIGNGRRGAGGNWLKRLFRYSALTKP